jgi:hypothetical protein
MQGHCSAVLLFIAALVGVVWAQTADHGDNVFMDSRLVLVSQCRAAPTQWLGAVAYYCPDIVSKYCSILPWSRSCPGPSVVDASTVANLTFDRSDQQALASARTPWGW